MLDKPILIVAHPKEIVGFLDYFRFGLVVGTLSVHQLSIRIKTFAAKAIEPLILAEVDVPLFFDPAQD